jgi:hypothetical protein
MSKLYIKQMRERHRDRDRRELKNLKMGFKTDKLTCKVMMLLEFLLFVVVVHGVIKQAKYSAPFS